MFAPANQLIASLGTSFTATGLRRTVVQNVPVARSCAGVKNTSTGAPGQTLTQQPQRAHSAGGIGFKGKTTDRSSVTAQRLLSTRTCFTLSGQADKACGTLRAKRHQLRLVLKGRITDHHRYMLNELMADHDRIEAKILRLETEIADRMTPYAGAIERLMTIPGTQADYCLVDRR